MYVYFIFMKLTHINLILYSSLNIQYILLFRLSASLSMWNHHGVDSDCVIAATATRGRQMIITKCLGLKQLLKEVNHQCV